MKVVASSELRVPSKNKSYEDLVVWQKSIELCDKIYSITKKFPREETYGLTSQIRRSAVSIPSNIAEGCARNSNGEFLQFLGIASGSIAELHTQLIIAFRQNIINEDDYRRTLNTITEVRKILNGLKSSLSVQPAKLATRNSQLATKR